MLFALSISTGLVSRAPMPQAQTKTYCSEPVRPFCVDQEAVFADATAQERCSIEVKAYREKIDEYLTCLDTLQQEVRQRAEEIEKQFSCKAGEAKDCP